MKNIEIEIQVQVEKIKPLLLFLASKGSNLKTNRQIDTYYTPSHIDFTLKRPVNEWLRLRDSDGTYSITYKNWHQDKHGKSQYCDEYETTLKEIKQMKLIFAALGIKQIAEVDKERSTFIFEDFEISVDQVKKLGDFVEIEYKGKGATIQSNEITRKMISLLKEIGVGKIYRNYVGYPFQIMFPDEVKIEEYN